MAEQVGEYFLRHDDVARRLGNMEQRELLDAIRDGQFGRDVIRVGRYFYVPMSGFNGFVSARRVFEISGELKPVFARSGSELRRKLA